MERDETPFTVDLAKIATLKPAFRKDGTVTAASSSSISDGAAATVLMSGAEAQRRGIRPLAHVLGYASFAREPEWFTTAPGGAIQKLLAQLGWKPGDAHLYEVNEAFAVVTMAAMRDVGFRSCAHQHSWRRLRTRDIPLARLARASSPRWCTRCRHVAAGAASRRCVSAAAKLPRSPSRCRPELHDWARVRYAVRVPQLRRGLTP